MASEEDDADEGKKVPGPKDPAVKAIARAAAAATKGRSASPALLTSSSPLAAGSNGGESSAEQMEVEQKKLLSRRQVSSLFISPILENLFVERHFLLFF